MRYAYLLTPPVFMFCDLTGVFGFEDIGPTTFWIQPEVFEATGEIMQGSPIGDHALASTTPDGKRTSSRGAARGHKHAVTTAELQAALDGASPWTAVSSARDTMRDAAAIVRIALDAYLERGKPDPRFLDPEQIYRMAGREPF